MTDVQVLKAYREKVLQLSLVEQQISQHGTTGAPRGARIQRYDATRGTNDPMAAERQLIEGLEAIADTLRRERDALRPRVDGILARGSGYPLQFVLQRYYLAGETDEGVAALLHMNDRYMCKLRNQFLRSLEVSPA